MGNKLCPLLENVFGANIGPPGSVVPPLVFGNSSHEPSLTYKADDVAGTSSQRKGSDHWLFLRPALFGVMIVCVTFGSGMFMVWLDEDDVDGYSWISVLKFGSIPLIAAIIGYSTNVLALWMMFWPIEFIGCCQHLKLGPPLDFYLCGYQGVIPMKVEEMAEIAYEMMTNKLIKVSEIFDRLDAGVMHKELQGVMPMIINDVLENAAHESLPTWWARLPAWVKRKLQERTLNATGALLSDFIDDMKANIDDVFDLKHCVVDCMVNNKRITNDLFFRCGKPELEFVKVTGFYLGYIFGLIQMVVWLFVRSWWILPICGVFVGYITNEFALKAIFLPANPHPICCGLYTVQGLFLKRQKEVSPIYADKVTKEIISIDNLIEEMCHGTKAEALHKLVDKHVMHCLREQIGNYKQLLQWSVGPDDLEKFQAAACGQFWKHFPSLLIHAKGYMEESMQLKATITERMQALPPKEFERLLHSVFEQDEFKLVLVGAILGALVGFLQALAQEPQQLGIGSD